ncbi:RHS repeat-associated core domain-containing protein [Pseudomonas purpurea]|uniref:RHS repeat domain-containing protein n=1 Tax=Pseudomonas purpurea TaxID=3136737 RepID=UPI0032660B15
MNPGVDSHTPHLTVIDGRGLPVRQVAYWRRDVSTLVPERRVTAQQHDAAGRLVAQRDPRLLAPTERPNLSTVYSLSGAVLLTDSVDAGWRLGLPGEAAQVLERWDGRGSHWQHEFDEQRRPTAIREQTRGAGATTVERLAYADNAPEFAERNQCGQLIRHDDPAGTQWFAAFGLMGGLLEQMRQFLSELDAPDWPVLVADRGKLFEPGVGATTRSRFNPVGEVIEQIDAKTNRQFFSQTVGGQLREVRLQLPKDPAPKTLVSEIQYNAHGQIERETAGNGVLTTLEYAAEDGRLSRLQAKRGNDDLQNLHYEYDPVGNVLSIEDAALPIRYFANQRIEPINRYCYDSLYQLIEATGWEAGAAHQGPSSSTSADPAAVGNYRQTYRYDAGNNLLELTHVGPQNPGHRLAAAAHSNRCLPVRNGVEPGEEDFRNGFDANGNLLNLQPGQALRWDLRNQLREVRPVERDSGPDDRECYFYGADGMRVRKVRSTHTKAQTVIAEVRYLPGLELRTHSGTGEVLQVISVQTGRGSVRALHWEAQRPAQIANDQQRYSLSDHLGSSTLELDHDAKVISQERYYPFGGTAWVDGEAVQVSYKTVRYSGKERDATGLYYYGFRYYVAWQQRWLNPDPAGEVDGLNMYRMVKSNPLTMQDVSGLAGESATYEVDLTRFSVGKLQDQLSVTSVSEFDRASKRYVRSTSFTVVEVGADKSPVSAEQAKEAALLFRKTYENWAGDADDSPWAKLSLDVRAKFTRYSDQADNVLGALDRRFTEGKTLPVAEDLRVRFFALVKNQEGEQARKIYGVLSVDVDTSDPKNIAVKFESPTPSPWTRHDLLQQLVKSGKSGDRTPARGIGKFMAINAMVRITKNLTPARGFGPVRNDRYIKEIRSYGGRTVAGK